MSKKYVSPSKLSIFLDNLKNIFAPLSHKHTLSDISDYVVDSSLSSTSTNPIQNKVINAEFDAVSEAMGALEAAIDEKLDTSTASSTYETKEDATTKLNEAKSYTDIEIDKLSDTVAFIDSTDNESVSDANNTLTTAHIVDGLNSSSSSMVLSAKQGKVLNERINTLTSLEEELEDARIDKDGNTHDNVGEHIRNVTSQLSSEIGDLKGSEATGISAELTGALRVYFINMQTLLSQLAYVSEDNIGNTLIANANNVVTVLGGNELAEYTITRNLVNCISSNTETTITEGSSLNETFVTGDGYTLRGAIVTVTMGGIDISSKYSNGVLNIDNVLGDIVISIEAIEDTGVIYSLENTIFDGTNFINTEIIPFETDSDWSIIADFVNDGDSRGVVRIFGAMNTESPWHGLFLQREDPSNVLFMSYLANNSRLSDMDVSKQFSAKMSITHIKDSNQIIIKRKVDNGSLIKLTLNSAAFYPVTEPLKFAYTGNYLWKGTMNNFKLYNRVLTDDEITAFFAE